MKFFHTIVLLTIARGILSALVAPNAQPGLSALLGSPLSNVTLNATGSNPLQRRKSYHVPNSPITLLFIAYTSPPTLTPAVTYQTLVTALNSIFHSTIFKHGDGLIFAETVSWSYPEADPKAVVTIENHGFDRTGQLTWGMLADTMYGVGVFMEMEACWSGEWMIQVEGFGDIGSGFVGAKVDDDMVESELAGTMAATA